MILDFAFNASFASLNVAKVMMKEIWMEFRVCHPSLQVVWKIKPVVQMYRNNSLIPSADM